MPYRRRIENSAKEAASATATPDLGTVAALEGLIRECVPEMDRLRSMPARLREAIYDTGLFHLVTPKDAGGHAVALPEALRIYEALAKIDASTAWCVAIGAGTAAFGSYMEPAAARESVWSLPLGIVVGTFMRFGRAVPERDGYTVQGRWPFSSGCVGADWYMAYCTIFDDGEPRVDESGNQAVVGLPVPMSECTIDDTWDSPGLRGTGSHHVSVAGSWVPASYGFTLDSAAHPGTPLHVLPLFAMLDCYLAAIASGVLQGALNDLFEIFGARAAEKGGVESFPASTALELTELLAEARARRAYLFGSVDALWESVEESRRSGSSSTADGLEVQLASKTFARRCPHLLSGLTLMGGGRALVEAPDLHKRLRDAHAIASHVQYSTPVTAGIGRASVRKFARA